MRLIGIVMRHRHISWRKLTCLLLALLYTTFLTSQVAYNIASAHNDPYKLRSIAHAKNAAKIVSVHAVQKKHAALIAKAKTRPVKRFHPKTAAAMAAAEIKPLKKFGREIFIQLGYKAPFIPSQFLNDQLQRGPPVSC